MPSHNMWLSMSQAFKNELWPYVNNGVEPVQFPEIANISQQTVDFFKNIHDEGALERLFKEWNAAGRTYKMWSFYANKPEDVGPIKTDLDMLSAAYDQDISVMGAWNYGSGSEVGNPTWYPIPSQTINFMPDVMTDPGDPEADPPVPPTYEPATEPTDTNLLYGQAPRDFSSFYA